MVSDITAILVAHDSAAKLPKALAALQRAHVPIILVDNASMDDSVAIGLAHNAHIIRNSHNQGFGRAMNQGLREAKTDFALLVNPDLVLDDDAVARLHQAALQWPDAGILAPRFIEPDGRVFFSNQSFLAQHLRNEKGARWLPEGDCCVPFLSGACWLVRRDLIMGLGGFDENIFLFYEDDDLCRRVSDAGYGLVHVHDALARHERGASAAPRKGRIFKARRHLAWSRAYVARKWGLKRPEWGILLQNLPKLLLSALLFQSARVERYGGTVQGALDSLRGRTALEIEGLE